MIVLTNTRKLYYKKTAINLKGWLRENKFKPYLLKKNHEERQFERTNELYINY